MQPQFYAKPWMPLTCPWTLERFQDFCYLLNERGITLKTFRFPLQETGALWLEISLGSLRPGFFPSSCDVLYTFVIHSIEISCSPWVLRLPIQSLELLRRFFFHKGEEFAQHELLLGCGFRVKEQEPAARMSRSSKSPPVPSWQVMGKVPAPQVQNGCKAS